MASRLLRLVLAALCAWCVWVAEGTSQRLVLGEGGYARLMTSPPPLTALTLAAWVNVTAFPEGIAPILTLVAPDAQSQTAFFLRHDGVGVLWGGPSGVPAHPLDRVDRHPRTRWVEAQPAAARRRREAIDYSGGLGDIVDLLADPRSGRSYDTWTPFGFVDVDQMGVDDLQAAPSDDLHILSLREGMGRSESYSDWTNVPYELTMQESSRPRTTVQDGDRPRIITEPSGADDFVVFNWNVPPAAPQTIPESPNQWSPIWRDKTPRPPPKAWAKVTPKTEVPARHTDKPGGWSSQVTEVKLELSGWRPQPIPGPVAVIPPRPADPPIAPAFRPPPKSASTRRPTPPAPPHHPTTPTPIHHPSTPVPTHHPTSPAPTRRTTTTTTTEFPTTKASTKGKPTTTSPKRPAPITTSRTTVPTAAPSPFTRYTTRRFTAAPSTIHPARKTLRPSRPSVPASRQPPRMPLWKLIKNPSMAHHQRHTTTKVKVPTPTTNPTTTTTTTRPTTTTTTTPSTTTTTPSTIPSTITNRAPRPTTTSSTTTTTTTTSRPPAPRPPPTDKLHVSGQKSKVSVWSNSASHKPTIRRNKWPGSETIAPRHVQEFQRAMGRAKEVRDGDMAVVYSVPITDVEAFNAMYRQYQQQETHHDHTPSEDENNPNHLGDDDLQPLPGYEETVAPVVLREEEAVLAPTEEPLPPTPARGAAVVKIPPPATSQPPRAPPTKRWHQLTLSTLGELRGDQWPPVTRYEVPPTRLPFSPAQRATSPPPPSPTTTKRVVTKAIPTTTLPPPPPPTPSVPVTLPPQLFHIAPPTALPLAPKSSQSGISSSFAVFHEEAAEPLALPGVQEAGVPAAHYQESSPLFLEQLPPQYLKPEDLPRPLANNRRQDTERLEELIFSADPEELLRRGLLPRPVHYVSSQDEADRWVQQQYLGQDGTSVGLSSPAANTLPRETPKEVQQEDGGFHFKKLPFDFRPNEWYHVAFTWSSDDHQAAVYVNGRLVGTLSGVLAGREALPGGGLTVVGHTLLPDLTDFDLTSRFRGEISELSMWGERLDEVQVQAVYGCGPAPPTTPALDWHQLSMRFYGEVFLQKSEALCGA